MIAGEDDGLRACAHAELVAREAAEMILAAQERANAFRDLSDNFFGDIETIGLIQPAEVVEGAEDCDGLSE